MTETVGIEGECGATDFPTHPNLLRTVVERAP
jgi:hypothetical protein